MNATLRARLSAALAVLRGRVPVAPALPAAPDVSGALAAVEKMRADAAALQKRADEARAMLERMKRAG